MSALPGPTADIMSVVSGFETLREHAGAEFWASPRPPAASLRRWFARTEGSSPEQILDGEVRLVETICSAIAVLPGNFELTALRDRPLAAVRAAIAGPVSGPFEQSG